MFGGDSGDDDLSFVDDAFLQDVFQATTSANIIQRGNESNKHNEKFRSSNFLPNSCPSKGQREGILSKPEHEIQRKMLILSDSNSNHNIADKNFHQNNIDLEVSNNRPPSSVTPPDSEFHKYSLSNYTGNRTLQKNDSASVNNINNATKPSTFRSKILQTLAKKKSVQYLGSAHNNETSATLNFGDRIFNSDTLASSGISILEKQKHSSFSSEDYRDEIGDQNPNHNAKTNQWRLSHNNIENNLATTVVPPKDERSIFRQEEFLKPSVTPVKSRIPMKRRTVSPGGPVVQKRKFPGPAGLLPQPGFSSSAAVPPEPNDESSSSLASRINKALVCSQTSANDFIKGPWQQMINDLDFDPDDPTSPIRVFTIKWVLRRAGLRGQAGVRKVPFLAVVIGSIDTTRTDPTVVLKDQTGEIMGTVASSVMNEFGDSLQIGSVVVLRGVTVLSPIGLRSVAVSRENIRRHYLNITPNTILSLYTLDCTGHIITTSLGTIDLRELSKQALSPTTAAGPKVIVEEDEDDRLKEQNSPYNNNSFSSPGNNNNFNNSPGQSTPHNQSPKYAQTAFQQRNGIVRQQWNLGNQRSGQSIPLNQSSKYPQGSFSNVQRNNIVSPSRNGNNIQRSNTGTIHPPGNLNAMHKNDNLRSPGNVDITQRNNILYSPRNPSNLQKYSQQQYQFQNSMTLTPRQTVPSLRPSLGQLSCAKPLHSSVASASSKLAVPNKEVGKSVSESQLYSSQAEETEVNELLSGLDADSFFEDF